MHRSVQDVLTDPELFTDNMIKVALKDRRVQAVLVMVFYKT